MKNIIDIKINKNNNYDDCGYRLSATSRAFCETHTAGSEWYELIPLIDYSQLATISSQAGDVLLTSPLKFVNPLYLSFNYDYSFLKEEWDKKVANFLKQNKIKKAEKEIEEYVPHRDIWGNYDYDKYIKIVEVLEYKGLPLHIFEFPTEEEIKRIVVSHFTDVFVKHIKIYNQGELFTIIKAPKNQEFSFENLPTLDNFKEFEAFLKDFYNLPKNYILIEDETSENSPIHYWGEACKPYLHKIDGFTFVEEEFVKKFAEEQNSRRKKFIEKTLNEVLNAKSYEELKYYHNPKSYKNEIEEDFKDLKDLFEKATKKYQSLKNEATKKELETYIKEAENFLNNKLYVVDDNIKKPEAPSSEIIDPDYYYSNEEKAKKAKEELIKKFGDTFVKANLIHKVIKENIKEIYSKAGSFYINKNDKIWNVKVPSNKKGLFIGKRGANIKALANEYKVKINLI